MERRRFGNTELAVSTVGIGCYEPFIIPIPGAKSRKHHEENVRAADIVLTADDLAELDRIVPPGAASGTRYQTGKCTE
jgi:aryl-alcohol dehydrogenase-like predicted oxidoreductase